MNALREAYLGFYENELEHLSPEARTGEVRKLIAAHKPKERLAVYLMWNGIYGYTDQIFAIATGEH
jgi:hypothetical protein